MKEDQRPYHTRAEQRLAADCLQRPVRRTSSCSIPIADGKDSEEILGSTAYLNPKGRGDKSLPIKPRMERRRWNYCSARPAWHGESCMACSPMPIGQWRASGASVCPPGGPFAQGSGRP